jgi:hypothetical protein
VHLLVNVIECKKNARNGQCQRRSRIFGGEVEGGNTTAFGASENRALRRTFGSKRERVPTSRVERSLVTFALHDILFG